ncbi:hypothetical protein ZWY2020_054466 [Hordeum vulgare]|nr:hypothetical protein ZWY2020_054466 [Hordeum vulgare]
MSSLRLRLRLCARHCSSTSKPSRSRCWYPHAAFAAAAERARSGNLTPQDAHNLFDELLQHGNPVQERPLNNLLAALARAPASNTCRNGPALAVALFSRMSQGARRRLAEPTTCTYGILMDCCCRAHRLDLALAFFGRLFRTGLEADQFVFNTLLKGLCHAKRADEALEVLLHRMPELGCIPDVVAYNMVIHGFFKEGQAGKACSLFHEMAQLGVMPNVVTYSSVIDALCKAKAMDKAEYFLRQMVDNGVVPNNVTYNSLVHGYSSSGHQKEAVRVLKEMTSQGIIPDVVTCNTLMASLCKNRRSKEAAEIIDYMVVKGLKPDIVSYSILLHGVQRNQEAKDLFAAVSANGLVADVFTYTIMMSNLIKEGSVEEADNLFSSMEKSGCTADSYMLNLIIRRLLEKGEMVKAGNYMSKVDAKSYSLEAKTVSLLISLFSGKGKYREHILLLPTKYQFHEEAGTVE